jgi:hypothetical protein
MAQRFGRIVSSVVIGVVAVMLFGCGGGGGSGSSVDDTMMSGAGDGDMMMPPTDASPSLPTDPQAIAAAADRVRDASSVNLKMNDDGNSITGYLYNDEAPWSGSRYTSMSQYYQDGSRATALMYYDEAGDLQIFGGPFQAVVPLQRNPGVWPFRIIRSDILDREVEGITESYSPIQDHGLGEKWQGVQMVNTYEGGGTLTFRAFTDLRAADNPGRPSVGHFADDANYRTILLTDSRVPEIPADQHGIHIGLPGAEGGLRGTLDGVAGIFSCASGTTNYCALEDGRHHLTPGFAPSVGFDPVKFTPDDGGAEVVLVPPEVMEVPTAKYLSFGNWLFVPADVTDTDAFDFGVFAGGDDPFMVDNLQGLIGTAEYEGESVGMYAETAVEATISRFNAKVALTADFGTADDSGSIVGRVYDFNIDGGQTSPLAELTLGGPPFWRDSETSNIFQTPPFLTNPVSGGFIEGDTSADGGWQGRWGGKFFGNGAAATNHPTSFAGTFGATDGDRSFVGSFGADKQ